MRAPVTLFLYIMRRALMGMLVAMLVMLGLVLLIESIELMRRASGKGDIPVTILMEMALLKIPAMTEKVMPFAVLIGGMIALTRLTRSNELAVARAAGISVWQFLMPVIALVLGLGIFLMTVFNPLSSIMLSRFEQLEGRYLTGKPSLLAVSSSGLWLRQIDGEGESRRETVVHALRVSQKDMRLYDVIIFRFGAADQFIGRVDAKSARLGEGVWYLQDALLTAPGQPAKRYSQYTLPTNLTLNQIHDSFASPQTLSFWELPSFITTLENAGFSALRHRLHWHSILALPLLLCAMIFIAATFSLRLPRKGGVSKLVGAGIFTGFVLYFLTDLVYALGISGTLPVVLAAWTPAGVSTLIGMTLLLHLEDG